MSHIYLSKEKYIRKKLHFYISEGCWWVRPLSPVSLDNIRSSHTAGQDVLEDLLCRSKSKGSSLFLYLDPSLTSKLSSRVAASFSPLPGRLPHAGGRTRERSANARSRSEENNLMEPWTLNTWMPSKKKLPFHCSHVVGSLGRCKRGIKWSHFHLLLTILEGWYFVGQ